MKTKLLVLSAPFGSGHLQAAQAIAAAAHRTGATAEVVDLNHPLLNQAAAGYRRLLAHAERAYQALYHVAPGPGLRRLLRLALGSAIRTEIARAEPNVIVCVCTHPFPAVAAAELRRRGSLTVPVAVAITDFVPHPLWIHEGIDHYFVPCTEAADRLRKSGVPPDRITVTGIPIQPAPEGLPDPEQPLFKRSSRRILVMGGGLGLGPIVEAVRSLAILPHANLTITVVCGQNQRLKAELEDLFGTGPRLEILGFTSLVPQLMQQADILVTKPGGLTCSEALAAQLPMLLLRPLPGHEEENADYLVSTGAARRVEERALGETVAAMLYDRPEGLALMAESARLAGRPDSAQAIASRLVALQRDAEQNAQWRLLGALPQLAGADR